MYCLGHTLTFSSFNIEKLPQKSSAESFLQSLCLGKHSIVIMGRYLHEYRQRLHSLFTLGVMAFQLALREVRAAEVPAGTIPMFVRV